MPGMDLGIDLGTSQVVITVAGAVWCCESRPFWPWMKKAAA